MAFPLRRAVSLVNRSRLFCTASFDRTPTATHVSLGGGVDLKLFTPAYVHDEEKFLDAVEKGCGRTCSTIVVTSHVLQARRPVLSATSCGHRRRHSRRGGMLDCLKGACKLLELTSATRSHADWSREVPRS